MDCVMCKQRVYGCWQLGVCVDETCVGGESMGGVCVCVEGVGKLNK